MVPRGAISNGGVTAATESGRRLRSALRTRLPAWTGCLAVVAHPDDESFGLGALLAAFSENGAATTLLCFTHGEASTFHGAPGDLHAVRADELSAAGAILRLQEAILLSYSDGHLGKACRTRLAGDAIDAARNVRADGLLVFDAGGVTGHPDHVAATAAALTAAAILDVPVLGWTLPQDVAETLNAERGTAFTGTPDDEIDFVVPVDRARQHAAIAAHASQAIPTSVLWRRLELLGDVEHLRLLYRPSNRE